MSEVVDKRSDLAGPGIGDYDQLRSVLPSDYRPRLSPLETQRALIAAKQYIEANLCDELNLTPVTVPLLVDTATGVNDYLDRDGSRTPVRFHISNDQQFGLAPGQGLLTDMKGVRTGPAAQGG